MSSLFRRKLDELEDMFIASQDDLLARFSSTYEENARLKAEIEMMKASSRGHSTSYLYQQMAEENARLKADIERLTKSVKFNFAGGDRLLADLNALLTAHRHFCDINAIKYSQMEKDALKFANNGKTKKTDDYNGNIKGLDF